LRNEFTRIQIAGLETTMKAWPPIYILDELHELAAFYRTPVGAKTQREKPQMMQEANARRAPRTYGISYGRRSKQPQES
jgi:hypothetical protein